MAKYFEITDLIEEYPDKMIYAVIGARGVGKSYSSKRMIIKDFLEDGKQALIYRRYSGQKDSMKKTYFNDIIKKEFPELEYKLVGDVGYIDDKPFCMFKALNSNDSAKGGAFPDVYTIIYEEIMPEPNESILKDEYAILESALTTADRYEDRIKIIAVGNNTSYYNPIFESLQAYPSPKPDSVVCKGEIVIKNLETPEEYVESVNDTRLARLQKQSGSYDYNVGNQNTTNDRENCGSKKELQLPATHKLQQMFSVRVGKTKVITVWRCELEEGYAYYYVDNNSKVKVKEYFYDPDLQTDSNEHISLCKDSDVYFLSYASKIGTVYWNTPETKYFFNTTFKFMKYV